jgi:hypothetical protein
MVAGRPLHVELDASDLFDTDIERHAFRSPDDDPSVGDGHQALLDVGRHVELLVLGEVELPFEIHRRHLLLAFRP